ncbi:hypothetical protein Sa4125_39980 [Aureimonas sp. SA4125]|nr:hypothetical protein Sa4125_39980 [Aureimonas sp. SA4125]
MTGTCLAALACAAVNGGARAQESPASSANGPLWGAHADIVGQTAREHSAAGVEFFVPLAQNQDSMIFIDAGINGDFDSEVYGTFGVGYRKIVSPDLILGGIVAIDVTQTDEGNSYGAISLGAEAIGTAAEARINVQLPFSGASRISDRTVALSQPGTLTLLDNRLVEQVSSRRITVDEVPLTGVEGEIGVNLPIGFDRLDDQLKAFVGAYHYDGDGVDSFTGVSGRLEYSVHDVLGDSLPGADLILSAGLTHDEAHGTNFAGEVRLRIPLGAPARTEADARVLSPIEERMTQRVVRTTRIQTSERTHSTTGIPQISVATDPLTGLPLNSIYVADGAETLGAGTLADPTTLEDAVQRAGGNGTIVAEGNNGTIDTPGVTLADGQRLVGGGVAIPVRLADGTVTNFQLGQTAPVIAGLPTANVISLAAGNRLQALTITGGLAGIAGTNVGTLTLQRITIAGSAATGFSIANNAGTNTLAIDGLSVAGVGGAGIAVNGLGGGTTTVTGFSGVGVASAGGGGVLFDGVTFDADPRAAGFQRVEAGDLTVGAQTDPAAIVGDGLRLNQVAGDLNFASLLIANIDGAGLFIRDRGGAGGDFNFGNTGGAITTVGGAAVDIDPVALAARFGSVSSVDADGQGSGGNNGLFLDNILARDGGSPALVIDAVLVDGATGDGLLATNNTGDLVFGTTTITNVGGHGIAAENNVGSLSFGTTSVTNAAGDGIELAGNAGPISFATTTITNPGGMGIFLASNAGSLTFADTAIANPGLGGINIAGTNGSVGFGHVDITGLGTGTGLDLTDKAGFASTRVALAFQTLDITGTGAAGSVGIDYSGSTNTFDVVTADSGTISGVAVGIDLRDAAATGLFQYGDGSATDADGRASQIDAARPLEIGGLNATTGIYNLRDVALVGDITNLTGVTVFYVDADGGNNPGIADGTAEDPGTLAQASASGADVIALVDNQSAGQDVIDAASAIQGALGSLTLATGQRVISFLLQDLIDLGGGRAPSNLLLTGIDANIVRNPNAGNGAPRLTTTEGGSNTLVLGRDNALLGTVIDNGAGAVAVFGNGISGVSIHSSEVASIALTNATGTGRIENSTIGQLALTGGTVALTGINADIVHSGAGAALSVTAGHSGSVSFDAASSISANGGTGLRFVGVSGAYALSGSARLAGGANLAISGATGSLSFGNVAITAPAGNGIDISGAAGTLSFGDVAITGVAAGAVALDFNGAALTGAFNARSLVATGSGGTPPAGSVGIDLRGVSGGQAIRIGVSPAPNPAADTPSSLTNFATGVFVDAASDAAFTFGDGEDAVDRGSRITATTAINAASAPTLGNYNFLDVDFLGAAPGAGFNPATVYYFSETGTGTGATQFDPGSIGGAEASGATVLVPIGPATINAANGGGLGSLDLAAAQQLRGFQTANGSLAVGFTGPATIQISALSATINNLTGRASPTLTTTAAGSNVVNLSSGNQLSAISTSGGASGIAGSSITNLIADNIRIANTSGAGIALIGTSGNIAFTGATSVTATGGAGVSIAAGSGTVSFATLSVDNSATAGVGVSVSGPGSFSFTNGLAIRTTTGSGLAASGGASLAVAATAGAEAIATTGGTALGLDGVTIGAGGLNLDSLLANGAATGIGLNNVGSSGGGISLGTVTLAGVTARGVDVSGTLGAGLNFGSLSIGLAGGTGTAFDLNGATLGAAITAGDFDVTNAGARGTTIGIDLTGLAGNQTVRLGDANPGGQSSSIAGVATGVVIANTSSAQFTFGDGEAATDRGSTIDATVDIAAPGSVPALASFNFRDLRLDGSPGSGFGVGRIFFVDSDGATGGGDGTGRDGANPAALAFAEANALAGDIIVLVNNGTAISAFATGADNTLLLLSSQEVRGFANGAVSLGFTAPAGFDFGGNSFSLADPTNGGAATLTSGLGNDVITLGASGNLIDGFILDGSPAGAARGIISAGSAGATIANMTVRNFTGPALHLQNLSGITTLTNVSVTGATGGAMRFDNAAGTVTATNVDLTGAAALVVAGGNAAFGFDAASSIANTGGLAVSLSARTGGSFTHAGTVTSDGAGAGGISISGATAANTVNFGGTVNLGGTTALGASGVVVDNAGTASILTFANLGVATNGVTALSAGNGGTVNVTAGSLSALGATAVALNAVTAGINLTSTSSTGGANNVALTNVAGSLVLGTGALSGATANAFAITGGTANIGYAGSITKTLGGQILSVDGHATGTLSFSGAVNASGLSGGILIQNTTGSTAGFTGAVTLSTGASNGVTLANNTGSVAFNGGLAVTTTSGAGFTASGGGTISVAAAGTRQITTTTGQILSLNGVTIGAGGASFGNLTASGIVAADAINLTGVTGSALSGATVSIAGTSGAGSDGIEVNNSSATFGFGATTIGATARNGISLSGNAGTVTFSGTTTLTNPGAAGVAVTGTNGTIGFDNLQIALQSDNTTGVDLRGANLDSGFTATDFDLTSTSPTGTTAIDLSFTTSTGIVRFGDTNVAGQSATIGGAGANAAGPTTGIQLDSANIANFIFGDGESTGDQGSRITATDRLDASPGPAGGSYNILDVDFLGAAPGPGFLPATAYYFSAGGTGTGSTINDPGSIAGAQASSASLLIPVGAAPIDAAGAGGSLDLDANQQLRAFDAPNGTLDIGFAYGGAGVIQTTATAGNISDTAGNGSPELTTTIAAPVINLSDGNTLSRIRINGGLVGVTSTVAINSLIANDLTVANTSGAGIALIGTSGNIAFTGATSVTATGGAGVSIAAGSGTVSFATLSVDNSATAGVGVSVSGPGSFSFTNGLAIRTTTGSGLAASGGASLAVAATAGAEAIATTGGTALGLDGVTIGAGGLNLDSLLANGAATGIGLNNVGSSGGGISLGTVTLAGVTARGVDVSGTLGAGLNFGSLSIGLAGGTGTAFDLNGATLGAAITAGDFDVTNAGARGTTIGIDLTGLAGNQTVRLGDANPGGQSSSIAGVATGVVIANTSSAQFTFGDGEAATDRGSTIDATVDIAAPGSVPALASFNFRDLRLDGSPGSGFGVGRIFFVDSDGATGGGDGTGRDGANPAALAFAEANALAGDIIVLVNNGTAISAFATGADNTLLLLSSQEVRGFANGAVSLGFTAPAGFDFGGNSFSLADPTNGGAATLTSGLGNDVITLGASGNLIDGFILDGSPAGAARGIISAGSAGATIANMTVRNFTGPALHLQNLSGITTLTNVSVTGATGGAMRFDNAAGTVTATNVDLTGAAALVVAGGNAAFGFDAASSIANTGGLAVSLSARTGGSFTHAGTVTSDGAGAGGISISGATAANTVNFGGTVNLGGTTALGASGVVVDNAGTASILTFANLGVATNGVTALSAGNGGTVNVTAGSLSALGATAVALNAVTAGINLTSTSSTGGANNVALTNVAGSLVLGTGALSGATANAFAITGGTANIGYAGSITKTLGGQILSVDGHATGTLSFSGAVNASGLSGGILIQNTTGSTAGFTGAVTLSTGASNGVTLANNTGSVAFNGGLAVTTTSGAGFTASGGGTISVAAAGTRQITTTTGQILSLNGVTIGAGGASFGNLTASGIVAADAINLTNVSGASFLGGTVSIAGTSGPGSDGIEVNNSSAIVNFGLNQVAINNTAGHGVNLVGANGTVTMFNTVVNGAAGSGVRISGTTGFVFLGGSLGATTVNNGPGLLVENTVSGTVQTTGINVRANGADAVQLANNAGAVLMNWPGTITQLGTGDGVDISGGTGNVTIDSSIVHSGAAGAAIRIAGTSATIAFDGDQITKTIGGVTADISDAIGAVQIGGIFGGAVTGSSGAGGLLIDNSNVTFGTQVSLTTGTANGVTVTNNSGRTVAFTGGLAINTTTGTGFTASGGGIVQVSAAGTRQINTTTGRILDWDAVNVETSVNFSSLTSTGLISTDAIYLASIGGAGTFSGGTVSIAGTSGVGSNGIEIAGSGPSLGIGFGPTTIGATGGNGIALTGNSGSIGFTGTTTINNPGAAGVDIDGGDGAISFANLQITLGSVNTTALDLSNATFSGNITAGDFDVDGGGLAGTLGINLTDTTGAGTVQLGDLLNNNPLGQASTIADVARGALFSSTTNTNLVFGDGAAPVESSIATFGGGRVIDDNGTGLPAAGTYDFDDVTFTGDASNLSAVSVYFIDPTGTGNGSLANPGSVAGAELSTSNVFVLVDKLLDATSGQIDMVNNAVHVSGGSVNSFDLKDGQVLISFASGDASIDVADFGISGSGAPNSFSFTTITNSTVISAPVGIDTVRPTLTTSIGNTINLATTGVGTITGGVARVLVANTGVSGDGIAVTSDQLSAFYLRNNTITANANAIDIRTSVGTLVADTFVLSVDGNSFSSTGGNVAVGISGQNLTAATNTVAIRSFANNTVLGSGSGGGITFDNVHFDGADTAGDQPVSAGTLTVGTTGARVQGGGISLVNPIGTLNFTTLDIANNSGTGLLVDTKGAGTTFTLNNTSGVVDTTNGVAFNLDPLTVGMTFSSVTATGGTNGIIFDQVAGTFNVTGATTISNTSGAGLSSINTNTGTFNFAALTVNNTTGGGIGWASGTLNVSGLANIDTTSGTAISQTGGVTSFTGGLDINTTSGTGYAATGGTVIVTGAGNTIGTQTGQLLEIQNTTIGAGGVQFDSLSATGAVLAGSAVTFLNTTGAGTTVDLGAITVAGAAGAGLVITNSAPNFEIASATISVAAGGISLNGANGTVRFDTIDLEAIAGIGFAISNNTSAISVLAGSVGAVNDPTATGLLISGGSGNIDFAASVRKTTFASPTVRVTGRTGGTVNITGAVVRENSGGEGIVVDTNTGGTINFTGAMTLATNAGSAVSLSNNTGATVNFSGGMAIANLLSGAGFIASGGGTIAVTGTNTISTGTGTALSLSGITVGGSGINLSGVSANGAANAILLTGVASTGGGSIALGTVNLQNVTGRGVGISGTMGAAMSFADLDISLNDSAAIAFDLNGATLNAFVTAGDFDVTNNAAAGTSVGVDLRGALGGSVVRLGDAAVAGASSSIAGVNTGVFLNAATNLAFSYGDGESVTDQGSTISAVVGIDASAAPVAGTYSFRDVFFPASPGLGFGIGDIYFVDSDGATGGGSGSGINGANPMTLGAAELASDGGDIIVLINNGSAITAAGTNANDTLLLSDGEQVRGFGGGAINLALTVPSTIQLASDSISIADPTAGGAATLTTSAGEDVIRLGSQNNIIDGFILDGDPAGAVRGINDNGAGATNTLVNNMTIRNFDTVGIEITPSTNTTITNTSFTGNVTDVLLNAAGTTLSNVTSTGATGTAFRLDNVTGTTALTNVSISGAANGGLTFSGSHAGTINLTNVDISGTNALNIIGGAGAFTFDSTSSITNSSGTAVTIVNRTGGAVNFAGTVVANGATNGVVVSGATGANTVSFTGTVDLGVGTALTGTAVSLADANTTTSFSNIDIVTNSAFGFNATGGGTVNVTTGTLNSTAAQAINLDGVAAGITFTSTTSSGGTNNAALNAVTGTVNLGSGAFSTATGANFLISGGTANVSYGGTISRTAAGRLIDIQNRTAGNVTFSGNLLATGGAASGIFANANSGGAVTFSGTTKTLNTGANAAVNLTSNAGATFNFTNGGLDIDTTSATGFNATGGGTVTVQGTGNTITSTTGTALNVANTNIGTADLTFQSITSNGGSATGIILDTTGSAGGLHVTGTGSAGSGGTIANKTGADGALTTGNGIYLNNTADVRLARMQLNDFQNSAIRGFAVNGFSLENSVISGTVGNNAGVIEGAIAFGDALALGTAGLTGSSLIDNVNISGSIEHQIEVYNQTGTMNLTVRNSSIHDGGVDGFQLEIRGTAQAFVHIDNNQIFNMGSQAIQMSALEQSNLHATIRRNTITRGTQGNEGIVISNGGDADARVLIGGPAAGDGNTISGFGGVAIFVGQVAGQGTAQSLLEATIQNNTVTSPASATNHAILAFLSSQVGQVSQARFLIDNNNVTYNSAAARAILVDAPDAGGYTPNFYATVTNNTVTATNAGAVTMISVAARNGATGHSDIRGNDVNYTTAVGVTGINVREATAGSNELARGGSGSNDSAAVLAANNPLSTTTVLPSAGDIPVVENNTILLPATPTLPSLP